MSKTPASTPIGDAADSRDQEDKPYAATAQVALQQSDYCAWDIWASFSIIRRVSSFRYNF
uniref:Genome sequencing data, contig C226 n=1 Tax=Microcystis aeruginosa (strain PCC 7806) TaxID=267872 RepID=A8Y9R1_MICA7|nr:unnamed protein product [Microcystis aeruginosa PCC 7806]